MRFADPGLAGLLKGLFEVRDATRPISACEMALIRLSYAAELPPTDKLVKDLLDGGAVPAPRGGGAPAPSAPGPRAGRQSAAPCQRVPRFPKARQPHPSHPRRRGRSVRAALGIARQPGAQCPSGPAGAGLIEIRPTARAPRTLANDLQTKLKAATGKPWMVSIASQGGAPTLAEQKQAAKTARFEAVAQEPLVRAVLDRFPGAEIVAVRDVVADEIAPAMPESDSEFLMAVLGSEIERLIQLLAKLPGLGPRSARRAALALLKKRDTLLEPLADSLREAADAILTCEVWAISIPRRLAPSAAIRAAIRMCFAWSRMWLICGRWSGRASSAAAIMCWAGPCRRWMVSRPSG